MVEKKHFLQSKTLRGAVVGIIGVLINQGVIDFISVEEVNEIIGLGTQLFGMFVVIYGRLKATKKLR